MSDRPPIPDSTLRALFDVVLSQEYSVGNDLVGVQALADRLDELGQANGAGELRRALATERGLSLAPDGDEWYILYQIRPTIFGLKEDCLKRGLLRQEDEIQ